MATPKREREESNISTRIIHHESTPGNTLASRSNILTLQKESLLEERGDRHTSRRFFRFPTRTSIPDELTRKEKIKNDNSEQDIQLKRRTLYFLLIFLAAQTALLFALITIQGLNIVKVDLDVLKVLVGGTIIQTYFMLKIAVEYLFPRT